MRPKCCYCPTSRTSVMFLLVVFAASPLVTAHSTLKLVYSPDSLSLSSGQPIDSSSVADFLSLALGYSLPKAFGWNGLTAITDVLNLPKASLTIRVATEDVVNSTLVFPIIERSLLDEEFEILSERTRERFGDKAVVVKMDSISDLNEELDENAILTNNLNSEFDLEDDNIKNYISEVQAIRQRVESLKRSKQNDDKSFRRRAILWFDVNHLSSITDSDAYDQQVKNDAKQLMSSLIEDVKRELIVVFDKRVIISVIEDKQMQPLVRKTRQASEPSSATKSNFSALNLAHQFQSDFHAAFAMVGFTTVLMAVAVFGISVAMWNLDPGKDSIIYRMTSQRIKKDQ